MLMNSQNLVDDFLKLIGNPVLDTDTALFKDTSHPILIENKNHAVCAACALAAQCTAKLEIYIPLLGRFIYENGYTGNIEVLISLLTHVSAVKNEYQQILAQSDIQEFYRQLAKKAIDLNPHAISAVDAQGRVIYQNIAAQNEGWDTGKTKHAVTFPIFHGSVGLGHIFFSKSHPYSSLSAPFANNNQESAFDHILGTDPAIVNCIDVSLQVSATNSTTLLLGESGTGKEIFARAIHKASLRRNEAFIALNCAAIPENLLESELFGYVDGAFTGAKKGGKVGRIVAADKGTLFLDEIGDLPLSLQAKLLRVLQDRKVEPVGSLKSTVVDVRFICATNQNIEALIAEKRFREDLYYRINVIPIHIPPLRTRKKDIAVLLHYNIKKYCVLNNKPFKMPDPHLIEKLVEYEWRGNVRELENVVEYAVTLCSDDCITAQHLPSYLKESLSDAAKPGRFQRQPSQAYTKPQSVPIRSLQDDDALTGLIKHYGESTQGKKEVARALGISLATLYRRLKKMKDSGGCQ